jgi:hypothetical protein
MVDILSQASAHEPDFGEVPFILRYTTKKAEQDERAAPLKKNARLLWKRQVRGERPGNVSSRNTTKPTIATMLGRTEAEAAILPQTGGTRRSRKGFAANLISAALTFRR